MKRLVLLSLTAFLATTSAQSQVYLADTAFTTDIGFGGAKASTISKPNGANYGFNMNNAQFFKLAEDFTVPAGQTWNIDQVTLYGYQTGSGNVPSISDINLQIRNGSVSGPSLFGDTSINRLTSIAFTNIYKVDTTASEGGVTSTQRPIMQLKVKITPTLTLTSGTYWMIWGASGNIAFTGPWCPPKVLPNRSNPASQNGMQLAGGVWKAAKDSASAATQQNVGFNFILHGPSYAGIGDVSKMDANLQLMPNPVKNSGTISFKITERGIVSVLIYDLTGKMVLKVLNEELNAGDHQVSFNTENLVSGNYFYELQTSNGKQMNKMQISK